LVKKIARELPDYHGSGFKNANVVLGTKKALDWFQNGTRARVLHVFDQACNLINAEGNILSIVTPELGPAPFSVVLDTAVNFRRWLDAETMLCFEPERATLGNLRVDVVRPNIWNPHPNWEKTNQRKVASALPFLQKELNASKILPGLPPDFPTEKNPVELTNFFVGRGSGLTPSGDDFLIGWMYGMWMIFNPNHAGEFGEQVYNTAIGRTTSLSLAWLKAAAKGEAGHQWHQLVDAIAGETESEIQQACKGIIQTGYSSGMDALAGFICSTKQYL